MFVLRSSILVQVCKKIFGIINKRCEGGVGLNKQWEGWKKNSKINKQRGDVYLELKSNFIEICS